MSQPTHSTFSIPDKPKGKHVEQAYASEKHLDQLESFIHQGKRIHISELPDQSFTAEDLKNTSLSRHAMDKLAPKMTDDLLLAKAKQFSNQVTQKNVPTITYEETLLHVYLPELIKRLEDRQ